jgi:hypothetical protein
MAADPLQYYIGKGVVEINTGSGYVDVGNVPVFELTPGVETLDHFSSRTGVRSLDRQVVVQTTVSLRMVLEEWTFENLLVALLGDETSDGSGNSAIDILANTSITAAVRFTGANEVGPTYKITLPSVKFTPSAALSVITEEWGQIELTGAVQSTGSPASFGKFTLIAVGA